MISIIIPPKWTVPFQFYVTGLVFLPPLDILQGLIAWNCL
jgi:hypothetical protein